MDNQIGDRGGADFLPSCGNAFEELGDCSWFLLFLWLAVVVVSAGGFEDAGFTEKLVICDKGDYMAEGRLYARGVEPVMAA